MNFNCGSFCVAIPYTVRAQKEEEIKEKATLVLSAAMNENYTTGIMDCATDTPSCAEAIFCPYCMVSQSYNMLTSKERSIHWMFCFGMMACDMFMSLGLALVVGNVITRSTARNVLRLTEANMWIDGCFSVFLLPCSICQTYREMSLRGLWPGGVCISTPFSIPHLQPPQQQTMVAQGVPLSAAAPQQHLGQPSGRLGYAENV